MARVLRARPRGAGSLSHGLPRAAQRSSAPHFPPAPHLHAPPWCGSFGTSHLARGLQAPLSPAGARARAAGVGFAVGGRMRLGARRAAPGGAWMAFARAQKGSHLAHPSACRHSRTPVRAGTPASSQHCFHSHVHACSVLALLVPKTSTCTACSQGRPYHPIHLLRLHAPRRRPFPPCADAWGCRGQTPCGPP